MGGPALDFSFSAAGELVERLNSRVANTPENQPARSDLKGAGRGAAEGVVSDGTAAVGGMDLKVRELVHGARGKAENSSAGTPEGSRRARAIDQGETFAAVTDELRP